MENIQQQANKFFALAAENANKLSTALHEKYKSYTSENIQIPQRIEQQISSMEQHLIQLGADSQVAAEKSDQLRQIYKEKYKLEKIKSYCVNTYEKAITMLFGQLGGSIFGQILHQNSLYNKIMPEWLTGTLLGMGSVFGASSAYEKWGHLLADINVDMSETLTKIKTNDDLTTCLENISEELNLAKLTRLSAEQILASYRQQETKLLLGANGSASFTPLVSFGAIPNTEVSKTALRAAATAGTVLFLAPKNVPQELQKVKTDEVQPQSRRTHSPGK